MVLQLDMERQEDMERAQYGVVLFLCIQQAGWGFPLPPPGFGKVRMMKPGQSTIRRLKPRPLHIIRVT